MKISEELVSTLKNLPAPAVIAISGFGGAGKSTFARHLAHAIHAPVIGVDAFGRGFGVSDFSLWEIMDFARLKTQVLEPFIKGKNPMEYHEFDWSEDRLTDMPMRVPHKGVIIVEGVGLFRPELMHYFAYAIWIDVPIEVAIARGKKRDREEYGNPTDELWDGVWKKNDIEYVAAFKPKEVADFVYSND